MNSAAPDHEKTFQTALALDEKGQSSEAVKLLEPLVQSRDNPRHLLAYAHCRYRAGGHWKEVVALLQTALTIEPRYFEGGTRLLLADLFIRNGLKEEAIAQWRIVAAMPPDGTGYGAVPDEAIIMLGKHDA